ncbi:MAG TPA: dethiobiotin synthase [Solirubrobacteraceae bacterium]|nr:dethiobiotin synthase [Solirubrobacteraceae bacterium]
MRGLFITGTDTDAGKTILAGALIAAMASAGEPVRAHKPAVTGLDEPSGSWPADHELLAAAAGMSPEQVAPLRYGPAVSPQLAAELAGEEVEPTRIVERARAAGELGLLVVEGAGGLLSPLAEDYTVCDLASVLGLPVLIAARPGLGTINLSLLTLQAARAAGLDVRAIVLTPWPAEPSRLQIANRDAIERMGEIEVAALARVESPDVDELACAGALLPWRRWLAG